MCSTPHPNHSTDLGKYDHKKFNTLTWFKYWSLQIDNKLRKIKSIPISWLSSNHSSHKEKIIKSVTQTRSHSPYIIHLSTQCLKFPKQNLSISHLFSRPTSTLLIFQIPSNIKQTLQNNPKQITRVLKFSLSRQHSSSPIK